MTTTTLWGYYNLSRSIYLQLCLPRAA
jgi:hypothetical protein